MRWSEQEACHYGDEEGCLHAYCCRALTGWRVFVDDFGNERHAPYRYCIYHAQLRYKELRHIVDPLESDLAEMAELSEQINQFSDRRRRRLLELVRNMPTLPY